jgi:uncharacterized damage-inducible protein DinB
MKPTQIFAHWGQIRAELLATMDKFSQEELSFTPFKGSWPVGQILLHIADCEDNWLHGLVQGNFKPWIFYNFSDYPTKPAILEVLDHAHSKTISLLSELDEKDLNVKYKTPNGEEFSLYWIIWHVLEHEIHHRGELSLIHGLLGREGLDG